MAVDARTDALATQDGLEVEPIKGRSLWQDAGRRFVRNRAAVVFLTLLLAVIAFTIIGPYLREILDREGRLGRFWARCRQLGVPVLRERPLSSASTRRAATSIRGSSRARRFR